MEAIQDLLRAVDKLAIASDAALRVARNGETEIFYTQLADIDNLIDDLRDALKEAVGA